MLLLVTQVILIVLYALFTEYEKFEDTVLPDGTVVATAADNSAANFATYYKPLIDVSFMIFIGMMTSPLN